MVWFGYEAPSAARRSNSHALGTCGISEESGYNPSPSYKSHILGEVFFWQACAVWTGIWIIISLASLSSRHFNRMLLVDLIIQPIPTDYELHG